MVYEIVLDFGVFNIQRGRDYVLLGQLQIFFNFIRQLSFCFMNVKLWCMFYYC